jgi:RimJ/RimL family protein N-acetyltransferase
MSFINTYMLPSSKTVDISLKEPFDVNCIIPISSVLETERVLVTPLIPSIHAKKFYEAYKEDPSLGQYLPVSWPTFEDYLAFYEGFIRQNTNAVMFVIIDKTKPRDDPRIPGQIAGVIGFLNISVENLSLEIGPVIVLPKFQRTFVSANAVGLALCYALDLPSEGGLGFRRVAWTANPLNEASVSAAEKIGFKREGLLRWTWVLPVHMEGKAVDGARGEGPGRDSVLLSITWDNWVSGTRDHVTKRMARV